MMRVENWNPNAFDQEFEDVAVERLVLAAEVVKSNARLLCPVGTVSRPIYKTGPYAGKEWTSRDAGQLKKSIRVVLKKSKSGKPLTKIRNVRVYAGHYLAYYARIVEFGKPFMRPALAQSISTVKQILGVK
jgi:hypothetical protein